MEKLKKLKLKKEVIDRLENDQMNRLVGGGNFCPTGNSLKECSLLETLCHCTENLCTDMGSMCCGPYTY